MKVTVFNVEHGFCAFIKTPTNHTVLIDCGCTGAFSPALYIDNAELADAAKRVFTAIDFGTSSLPVPVPLLGITIR
jgi:hypothetical protein